MATGTASPCGACKFLRRKCAANCIFAPYFCSEQGPARFAAIHKVFGASNVSKLLLHIPVANRCEAVVTIAYEAQARIRDPVYGCVSHIFALQQQVAYLQAQLMQVKAQLAQNLVESRNQENHWPSCNINGGMASSFQTFQTNYMNSCSISPQSSLDSIDHHHGYIGTLDLQSSRDEVSFQPYFSKKGASQSDLSELQALAIRMMKH
ncbi:unnamed protein product [Fraxinus pennsylvanica]|uniref:LOB domain-containing protein n=1 Tax=Fraxinus pennsylvanica TaxID=56036 RepID=A0AAD2E733_9LAMI|nr:unnamed protein product [Fraxinus pennsylvanica]